MGRSRVEANDASCKSWEDAFTSSYLAFRWHKRDGVFRKKEAAAADFLNREAVSLKLLADFFIERTFHSHDGLSLFCEKESDRSFNERRKFFEGDACPCQNFISHAVKDNGPLRPRRTQMNHQYRFFRNRVRKWVSGPIEPHASP